ncbi:MAG: hypothetical protein J0L55_06665 [Caulobacterales bacterium]|nr:hypothetical protein [Caulobacterales bacterium]MCA0371312.1 hypothetical protein [Pseudomonadota bacterium]
MTPFSCPKDAALLHGSERQTPLKMLAFPAGFFLLTAQNHSHHLGKINEFMT